MRQVQLYISGERVDLFNDESITVTDTIQNVRDISNLFVPFSQSFNVPASKVNNKIFKHYYNTDISVGFDGQRMVDAEIYLNNVLWKKGNIKLESVDLRDESPYSYNITFYGSTIQLKEIFGEDQLSDLSYLSNYEFIYSATNIRDYLKDNDMSFQGDSNAMVIPLISCKTQLYYDSSSHDVEYWDGDKINPDGGNLYYHTGLGHMHGVYWKEIKPAIRLHLIIDAIEREYGITFTSDSFIKDTTNDQWYELYMWLHRNKGFIPTKTIHTQLYSSFTPDSTSVSGFDLYADYAEVTTQVISSLEIYSSIPTTFTVDIRKDGVSLFKETFEEASSGSLLNNTILFSGIYKIYITGVEGVNFKTNWTVSSYLFTSAYETILTNQKFIVSDQIPEMKVIDFMTGLFRMFNLVAYVQNDGEIKVIPLQDYYDEGTDRDITEFINTNERSVSPTQLFREIKLEYEGRGTQLANLFEEENIKGWGTEWYLSENDKIGDSVKITIPFEHMQFLRLDSTDIQVGWFVDSSDAEYYGKPLLFYPHYVSSGTSISFLEDETTKTELTSYVIPTNQVDITAVDDDSNHFSVELSEYDESYLRGSLYANYYDDYITSLLDGAARLIRVKANLPLSFLLQYSLADRLIIKGTYYRINSIRTNLQTGVSELEIINL